MVNDVPCSPRVCDAAFCLVCALGGSRLWLFAEQRLWEVWRQPWVRKLLFITCIDGDSLIAMEPAGGGGSGSNQGWQRKAAPTGSVEIGQLL